MSDDAQAILRRCIERYQSVVEYFDRGDVVHEQPSLRGRFETKFRRGVSLSFAFSSEESPWNTFEVTADFEQQRYSLKHPNREKSFSDFGLVVAAATGISLGSLTLISNLLMADQVGANGLNQLTDLTPLEQIDWHGEDCWSVTGRWRAEEMRLLIEKRRLCVRRIVQGDVVLEYTPTVIV